VTGRLVRAAAGPALLVLAVMIQVTLVNRAPLPGAGRPDLVLLMALALAVAGGPAAGMAAGFLGGLALDLAPPAGGLPGENALVFCLVGYCCGMLAAQASSGGQRPQGLAPAAGGAGARATGARARQEPTAMLANLAGGIVAAETLRAGLGLLLSDPDMTASAVGHVLPAAIVYDLLLTPFAMLLALMLRGAPRDPGRAIFEPSPAPLQPGRVAFRPVATGATAAAVPRLTFASARPAPVRTPARREPKLRFSGSSRFAGSSRARPPGAASPARAGARRRGLHRRGLHRRGLRRRGLRGNGVRGNGVFGGGTRTARAAPRAAMSAPVLPSRAAPFRPAPLRAASRGPGRNWLRAHRRPAASRQLAVPGRGWAGSRRGLRFRYAPGIGTGLARGPWTGPAAARKASPGKGWLRPAKPPRPPRRRTPGRGWLARRPPRLMWQRKPSSLRSLRHKARTLTGGRR
jgi:hypothetical protein